MKRKENQSHIHIFQLNRFETGTATTTTTNFLHLSVFVSLHGNFVCMPHPSLALYALMSVYFVCKTKRNEKQQQQQQQHDFYKNGTKSYK